MYDKYENKIQISNNYILNIIKNVGEKMKNNRYMMYAEDISEELGISKGHAYKIIKELNQELKAAGFIVISGRVPRAFWETKFYGSNKQVEKVS